MSKDKSPESPEEIAKQYRAIILGACKRQNLNSKPHTETLCDKLLFSTLPEVLEDDFKKYSDVVKDTINSKPKEYAKLAETLPQAMSELREMNIQDPEIKASTEQCFREHIVEGQNQKTKWRDSVTSSRNEKRCIVM